MRSLTIREQTLGGRLVKVNQELNSLKTSQKYGMRQVQISQSNRLRYDATWQTWTMGTYSWEAYGIKKRFLFVGQYPDRVATGILSVPVAYTSISGRAGMVDLYYYGSSKPNEVIIDYSCVGGQDPFSEEYVFLANMKGILKEA